ncbi:MFS transporter [Georgenia sp. Z1491]|uniref:MFS transporter n=1 Tax=Georgenia sp. Z1491 TaxID=3416707 RepID=UPI003CEA78FF
MSEVIARHESGVGRRRLALLALFLLPGLAISSWVTRTPAIRDAIGASTAEMGLVLLGLSVGSMVGILAAGPLVTRFGGKPVVVVGMTLLVLSMPTIGLGSALGEQSVITAGLALFGAGMGSGEVAMNVEGAAIEELTGRSFLPVMHGCFSLGTVIGALLGMLATWGGFPVGVHLVLVGAVALVVALASMSLVPGGTGRVDPATRALTAAGPRVRVWKDSRLLLIGLVVLAMALAEGTANDWLPLIMVDGHGVDLALGSAVYAVFAASMMVGRFAGGAIVERIGRPVVLAGSAMSGVVGLGLVAFVDSQLVAGLAVVLWGLGTSLGFPLALSAAGDSGPEPASRVALVSTVGYLAFLVGPPVLGFLGEEVGLRNALIVPMVVLVGAAFLTPATARRGAPDDDAPTSRTPGAGEGGAPRADGGHGPGTTTSHAGSGESLAPVGARRE